MARRSRRARVEDLHEVALGLPGTAATGTLDERPAAVLLRESRLGELSRDELAEVVQDAWLGRAPRRPAKEWLATREL